MQQKMATFKVYDPTTGQYVEKEVEGMAQEAAQPVVQAVQEAAQATLALTLKGPVLLSF